MPKEARTIKVHPQSELARLIKEAVTAGTEVIIDTGEARYPLVPVRTPPPAEPTSSRASSKRGSRPPQAEASVVARTAGALESEQPAVSAEGPRALAEEALAENTTPPARLARTIPLPKRKRRTGVLTLDDPLFSLVGIGHSGIPGGISGRKYDFFRKAFGSSE